MMCETNVTPIRLSRMPPAMTLVAFAVIDKPVACGGALAAAAWTGFYPAFFGPVWLGWQWQRGWKHAVQFSTTIAVISAVMIAWVLIASRPAPGLSLVSTIVRDTFRSEEHTSELQSPC